MADPWSFDPEDEESSPSSPPPGNPTPPSGPVDPWSFDEPVSPTPAPVADPWLFGYQGTGDVTPPSQYIDLGDGQYLDITGSPFAEEFVKDGNYTLDDYQAYLEEQRRLIQQSQDVHSAMTRGWGSGETYVEDDMQVEDMPYEDWVRQQYNEFISDTEQQQYADRINPLMPGESGWNDEDQSALDEAWEVQRDEDGNVVYASEDKYQPVLADMQRLQDFINQAEEDDDDEKSEEELDVLKVHRDLILSQVLRAVPEEEIERAGLLELARGAGGRIDDDPGGWQGFLQNTPGVNTVWNAVAWGGDVLGGVVEAVVLSPIRTAGESLGEVVTGDFGAAGETLAAGLDYSGERLQESAVDFVDPAVRAVPGGWGEGQLALAQANTDAEAAEALRRTGWDVDEDGVVNAREVFGIDPEWGGRWMGALDTLVLIAADPSTWAGVGIASKARLGHGAIAGRYGSDVADAVMSRGINEVLSPAQIARVQDDIFQMVEASQSGRARAWAQSFRRSAPDDLEARVLQRTGDVMEGLQTPTGVLSMGSRSVDSTSGLRSRLSRTRNMEVLDNPVSKITNQMSEGADVIDQGAVSRLFSPEKASSYRSNIVPDDVTVSPNGRELRVTTELLDQVDGDILPAGRANWRMTVEPDNTVVAHLDEIDVLEEFQGRGLGSAHVEAVMDGLRKSDIDEIRFNAVDDGAKVWAKPKFNAEFQELDRMTTAGLTNVRRLANQMGRATKELKYRNLADDIKEMLDTGDLTLVTPADISRVLGPEALDEFVAGWKGVIRTPGVPQVLGGPRASTFRRAAGTMVPDSVTNTFNRAFRPRSGVRTSERFGGDAAERLDMATSAARGKAERQVEDMMNRLGPAYRRASRAVDDLDEMISEVMEGPVLTAKQKEQLGETGMADARMARIEAKLDELNRAAAAGEKGAAEAAEFLERLRVIDDEITTLTRRSGLPVRQDYFPRILTEKGEKFLKQNRASREALGYADDSDIHSNTRQFAPDEKVADANKAAHTPVGEYTPEGYPGLGVPDDVELFETNALLAYGVRSKSAYRAAARAEMMEALAKQSDNMGNPILIIDDGLRGRKVRERAERLYGQGSIDLPDGRRIHGPQEILDEIEHVRSVLDNGELMDDFRQLFRDWNDAWGRGATSPIGKGTAFHIRNMVGNIYNNFMGGVFNPRHYSRAGQLQRHMHDIRKVMGDTGKSWDDAAEQLRVPRADRNVLRQMRDAGVMNVDSIADISRQNLDEFLGGVDRWSRKSTRGKVDQAFQTATMANWGQAMGTAIENNARMAHFLSKIDEGLSVPQAAGSTRKYLFDYTDLTNFEKSLRMASRFYTWTRKNIGLHLDTMWRHPGRIPIAQDLYNQAFGEDSEGLPEWANKAGFRAGGGVSNITGMGDSAMYDIPLMGMEDSVASLLDVANFLPIIQQAAPGDNTDAKDAVRGMVNGWITGGPAEAAKAAIEYFAEERFFEGDYEEPAQNSGFQQRLELISWLYPQVEGMARTAAKLDFLPDEMNEWLRNEMMSTSQQEMAWRQHFWDLTMGLKTRDLLATSAEDIQAGLDRDVFGWEGAGLEGTEPFGAIGEEWAQVRDLFEQKGWKLPDMDMLDSLGYQPYITEGQKKASAVVEPYQSEVDRLQEKKAEAGDMWTPDQERELQEALDAEQRRLAEEAASGTQRFTNELGTEVVRTQRQRFDNWLEDNDMYAVDDDGNVKVDDKGNPVVSRTTLAAATYNQQFPDDPLLKDDGTPVTYWDVQGEWNTEHPQHSTFSEVREWAIQNNAPLTDSGNPTAAVVRGYNATHPQRPYLRTIQERLDAGIYPNVGAHFFKVDGVEYVTWPGGTALVSDVDLSEWGPPGFSLDGGG